MRELISATLIFFVWLFIGSAVLAHGGETATSTPDHTAREEAEGQALWGKLQAQKLACANFDNDDFAALGEYFMGQMLGASHESMNSMMTRMMGEEGEKEAHQVMGKRFSGCDASAVLPQGYGGWMPMMNMMTGRWSAPRGDNQGLNYMMWNGFGNMMGYGWGGLGLVSWVTTLLVWAALVLVIIALWRWIQKH